MDDRQFFISEVSKMVGVEPHVLRYWEEELGLAIERNSQGKRCYTRQDIEKFRKIKFWKDKGMQLRAVREILDDPNLAVELSEGCQEKGTETVEDGGPEEEAGEGSEQEHVEYEVIPVEEPSDSARRLERLLDGMITRSLEKNNEKLVRAICDVILQELEERMEVKMEEKAKILVEREMMREMVDQGARESAAAKEKEKHPGRLWRRWKRWLEEKIQ